MRNFIVRMIKSRILGWAGHVARMEGGRSAFKILTYSPAGMRLLRRPRRRWEDNITRRMDLKEIGINTRNWVDLTQDRDYWSALVRGIEPPGSISHESVSHIHLI